MGTCSQTLYMLHAYAHGFGHTNWVNSLIWPCVCMVPWKISTAAEEATLHVTRFMTTDWEGGHATNIQRLACLWNGMKEGCLVGRGVIINL